MQIFCSVDGSSIIIYELNKNVLSLDLNEENEIVCLSSIGSLFQTSGAAALNDRLAVSVLSLFTVNILNPMV